MNYSPQQNYCNEAESFQSVSSKTSLAEKHPDWSDSKINQYRESSFYSCNDGYKMGSLQDNQIYIAATNDQHNQIVKGEHVDANGGLSGYFSDQATIDACKNGDVLDNTKYNEMCQIAPYRPNGIEGEGDATYKPHIDCFEIDRNALYKEYGTYDFNVAISKCEANNQFGSGGGNQGYNPYISDMIDDGILKHNPERSYSDASISTTPHHNPNQLTNSIVPEDRVEQMYADAQTRAHDCVNNDTPHPSESACNNGFPHNENHIVSNTGHAIPYENNQFNPEDYIPKQYLETPSGVSMSAGIQ